MDPYRRRCLFALFLVFLATGIPLFRPAVAWAMKVAPVYLNLEPGGRVSAGSIVVTNPASTAIAVEVTMATREISLDGDIRTGHPVDDFVVFPPQAFIEAGASQVFRIQWIGGRPVERSEAYHAVIRQAPVDPDTPFRGLRFLVIFNTVVYLNPPHAEPRLQVVAVEPLRGAKTGSAVRVTLENTGTRYEYLTNRTFVLRARRASGATVEAFRLNGATVRELFGNIVVMPQARRRFVLPLREMFADATYVLEDE